MFIIAFFAILKFWKQSKCLSTGQWKSNVHFRAVSLGELDACIEKDDFGKSKLSEKNQNILTYHLHAHLKHTKQYCLSLLDSNICVVKIIKTQILQAQENEFSEEEAEWAQRQLKQG